MRVNKSTSKYARKFGHEINYLSLRRVSPFFGVYPCQPFTHLLK